MHLHFVFPRWQKLLEDHPGLRDMLSGYDVGNFKMTGLGLATAVGAVPPQHNVSLIDLHVAEPNFNINADLVCFGFFTPQAASAYQMAHRFRQAGKTVIAGGIHPTVMPDDAAPHFDSILMGPAEGAWESIIHDHNAGQLKPRYSGNPGAGFARPRRDLFKDSSYLRVGVVQTARGCPMSCSFCVIPAHAGDRVFPRPISEVLDDIATQPFPCFFFADESLLFPDAANSAYRIELFTKLVEARNRRFSFIAAYPQFARQLRSDEINLMARAKLRQIYLVLGLRKPLSIDLKDQTLVKKILELKTAGVEVMASFNLGNDGDLSPVEPQIATFCGEARINLAEFIIHTPFPGTVLFTRMEKEGRLLTRDWSKYNGANVVFAPRHELPEDLLNRYLDLWCWFYGRMNKDQVHIRYARAFGGAILRHPLQ